MQTQFNTLPDWDFVGGETQYRIFELYESNGTTLCDFPSPVGQLAIVDFVNQESEFPVIKGLTFKKDAQGRTSQVVACLAPEDTINMSGKYLYQLTVKDAEGNVVAPHGIMHIYKNLNPDFCVTAEEV